LLQDGCAKLHGNNLTPAVRQLLLQARGTDELDTAASAVEGEAMEETEIISVFWAEGAAMPSADEISADQATRSNSRSAAPATSTRPKK
jgi:hypothetical protein